MKVINPISKLSTIFFLFLFFNGNLKAQNNQDTILLHAELNDVIIIDKKVDYKSILKGLVDHNAEQLIDTTFIYGIWYRKGEDSFHLAFLNVHFKNKTVQQCDISLLENTEILSPEFSRAWHISFNSLYDGNPLFQLNTAYTALIKSKGLVNFKRNAIKEMRFETYGWGSSALEAYKMEGYVFDSLGILKEYTSFYNFQSIEKSKIIHYKDFDSRAYPQTITVSKKDNNDEAIIFKMIDSTSIHYPIKWRNYRYTTGLFTLPRK